MNRLALIRKLNQLSPPELGMIIFELSPPPGVVPSTLASSGDRSFALLEWAQSPTGPGLEQVESVLNQVITEALPDRELITQPEPSSDKLPTDLIARNKLGQQKPEVTTRHLRNNLPRSFTSFVGRKEDIAQVKELLVHSCLVTLTGPGGVGKTRLGLEVGRDLVDEYPDGVWLVELASLSDPALLPQVVGAVLQVREVTGQPLVESLLDRLVDKELLLFLDNCEHLIDACAGLAELLLRECKSLKILGTSRQPLGCEGESLWFISPLAFPHAGTAGMVMEDMESYTSRYDSLQLFIARARAISPSFRVTTQNADALARVCRRLDGIPLAIELAAARVRALSVEVIAERLDHRFDLLTGGGRTALVHHQTLEALIAWSYGLLSETERIMLQRFSVFCDGWTLDAAEDVCGYAPIEHHQVLDLLTSLVDKSLVFYEEKGERYRLLETIRQYSRDRLADAGMEGIIYQRHLNYSMEFAERAQRELTGPCQTRWLEQLEAEHDNLRSALDWGQESNIEMAIRLAGALGRFWQVRGYFSEGRKRLTGILVRYPACDKFRANALNWNGVLAMYQGDYPVAHNLFIEGLRIWRELGSKKGIAESLGCLGVAAKYQGNLEEAHGLLLESLAIAQDAGDLISVAGSLGYLGIIASSIGKEEAALRYYKESLRIREELGDKWGIAASLNNMGSLAWRQGDHVKARKLFEESLAMRRELGDRRCVAVTLNNLAHTALGEGQLVTANQLFGESMEICREIGDKRSIAHSLTAFALLAANQPKRAARLYGAAEALRHSISSSTSPSEHIAYDLDVTRVRTSMDPEAFSSAWAEGQAMTLDHAIDYALQTEDVST